MKGSYLLNIYLENDSLISIGKLGKLKFDKGYYIYVGSALNGLEQRINRHLKEKKKLYWHIDYLLKYVKIIDIFYKENENKQECIVATKFKNKLVSIPGFGSSDCKCKSHLFYGNYYKIKEIIKNLNMELFFCDAKY